MEPRQNTLPFLGASQNHAIAYIIGVKLRNKREAFEISPASKEKSLAAFGGLQSIDAGIEPERLGSARKCYGVTHHYSTWSLQPRMIEFPDSAFKSPREIRLGLDGHMLVV
jgi:hypothetical protein